MPVLTVEQCQMLVLQGAAVVDDAMVVVNGAAINLEPAMGQALQSMEGGICPPGWFEQVLWQRVAAVVNGDLRVISASEQGAENGRAIASI